MEYIGAVIFDMNGVMVDDEKFQEQAWRKFLNRHGIQFTGEEFREYVLGRTSVDILSHFFQGKISAKDIDRYVQERSELAKNLFLPHLSLTDGLPYFLESLRHVGIKMGIATSSRQDYIDFILDGTQTRDYFDIIVDGTIAKRSKPDPEIYILAAQKLGTERENCIVFEDSIIGVEAAKRAEMKVVGITTSCSLQELGEADMVIKSFREISLMDLRKLFSDLDD